MAWVGVVALDEVEPIVQPLQHLLVDRVDRLADRLRGVLPEVVVGPVAPGDADDGHVELASALHVVERREQLSLGEVAGGAEQHEGIGLRQPPTEPRRRAALRGWPTSAGTVWSSSVIGCSRFFSAWPPKPARIAESTLFATSARPRDVNRSNSDADSTGTGTPSSIAAVIVHRPSPESDTRPSNASSFGSFASASAVRSSSQLATTLPRRHTSVTAARSMS